MKKMSFLPIIGAMNIKDCNNLLESILSYNDDVCKKATELSEEMFKTFGTDNFNMVEYEERFEAIKQEFNNVKSMLNLNDYYFSKWKKYALDESYVSPKYWC
jgi:hypothetical protein